MEERKYAHFNPSDFQFTLEKGGYGNYDHYNTAVPTDTFFQQVHDYLREQHPGML